MITSNVVKAMQTSAEQIARGAELIANEVRDWQMIKQYMSNRLVNIELTEPQQEKLEKMNFVYNNLASGKYNEPQVVRLLEDKYGICSKEAYNIINATKEIYETSFSINKLFELKVELESAKKFRATCIAAKDYKTAGYMYKVILDLLGMIEPMEKETESFEGHIIEAVFDPTLLTGGKAINIDMTALLNKINAKRKSKIKIEKFIEEIPYTEVNENNKTAL